MKPTEDRPSEEPFRLGPDAVALLSETFPETTLPDGRPARLIVTTLGTDVYLTGDTFTVDGYWDEPDKASKFRKASQEEAWKTLRILGTPPTCRPCSASSPVRPTKAAHVLRASLQDGFTSKEFAPRSSALSAPASDGLRSRLFRRGRVDRTLHHQSPLNWADIPIG